MSTLSLNSREVLLRTVTESFEFEEGSIVSYPPLEIKDVT
jgi:hypothetical protein